MSRSSDRPFSKSPGSSNGPGEQTLIVACEFTARKYRQPLTASARLAKHASRAIPEEDLPIEIDAAEPDDFSGFSEKAKEHLPGELSPEAAECKELAEGAGARVLDVIVQRRDHPDPATLVGKGKLEEIAAIANTRRADLIIFEQDLSPSQLRELESTLPCRVIDRTQLILDIFASHARTREGQLQVELAQLEYLLPRLAGRGR